MTHSSDAASQPEPVDAVITWVDGSDPALREEQSQYFPVQTDDPTMSAERYSDAGELFYCLACLFRNARFLRKIFIVTDGQTPRCLDKIESIFGAEARARIKIVDHQEIFAGYEQYLPVFNSPAIETMLHKIPGLSERYIYLNDDFFITSPVREGDFFANNRPVLRGKWRSNITATYRRLLRNKPALNAIGLKSKPFSYKETQFLAFERLGFEKRYFWHDHTPHPFIRSDLEAYFSEHPHALEANVSHRTRHHSQFDVMALAFGLDLQKGESTFAPISLTYMKASDKDPEKQLDYVARKRALHEADNHKFLCVQSLSDAEAPAQKQIYDWLDHLAFGDGE